MVDLAAGQQRVENGALPWRHEFTSTDGSMQVNVMSCRVAVDGREEARAGGSFIGAIWLATLVD
jgi:hypothetical protein